MNETSKRFENLEDFEKVMAIITMALMDAGQVEGLKDREKLIRATLRLHSLEIIRDFSKFLIKNGESQEDFCQLVLNTLRQIIDRQHEEGQRFIKAVEDHLGWGETLQ